MRRSEFWWWHHARAKIVVRWNLIEIKLVGKLRVHRSRARACNVIRKSRRRGQRVAEAWRCVYAGREWLIRLFVELGALNYVFDDFLLLSALLVIAPPHWSLVLAFESEMLASST